MLVQSCHAYNLIIPPQYHNSETLSSFINLKKVFYQSESQYYYAQSFNNYAIYEDGYLFYELMLRGCLIRKKASVRIDHWNYVYADNFFEDMSISRLLMKYVPPKSPVKPLIYRKTNQFFHLMPLQCLYQFLKGLTYSEFHHCMNSTIEVANIMTLKSEPIVRATQLKSYYGGFILSDQCKDFFIREGYFYYEDLVDFDWNLLLAIPSVGQCKVNKLKQLYAATFL